MFETDFSYGRCCKCVLHCGYDVVCCCSRAALIPPETEQERLIREAITRELAEEHLPKEIVNHILAKYL